MSDFNNPTNEWWRKNMEWSKTPDPQKFDYPSVIHTSSVFGEAADEFPKPYEPIKAIDDKARGMFNA